MLADRKDVVAMDRLTKLSRETQAAKLDATAYSA